MLYDILANRNAVNILKWLSENEKKKIYSSNINAIKGEREIISKAINLLASEGLIYNEENLLSISEKGKRFIEIFDRLVALMKNQPEETKTNFEIIYDLTDFEKKVLFTLFRLQQETGKDIPLVLITQEIFPYENLDKKKIKVSGALRKLEQLNLITKTKKERSIFAQMTESGTRVIKRQMEKELCKII